jgi:hypothetical protein
LPCLTLGKSSNELIRKAPAAHVAGHSHHRREHYEDQACLRESAAAKKSSFDAYAEWDVDTQSWELASIYRGNVFGDEIWCVDCDGETNIIEQEIKETTE